MTAARQSTYQFGPFRLEARDHRLLRDGRAVPLTPKVFSLLRVLVEHSGHLVEKDDLLKQVWPESSVEEGALNRAVSVLRKALDDNPSGQKYIETVPKRGYRFAGQVTALDDEEVISRSKGFPAPATSHITRRSGNRRSGPRARAHGRYRVGLLAPSRRGTRQGHRCPRRCTGK